MQMYNVIIMCLQVHMLIKATYKKTENAVMSRVRDSSYPRMSLGPNSDRRMTYSTGLPSNDVDNIKDQYATIRPKLHVAEIISIQASERLAEILEPVYETIENGIANEGYDSLERSDIDNDSGFIPNRESGEDFYGFTNASSISIDCQDWIRCISSPSSSVYDNSLNEYEAKYLEKKFPNFPKPEHKETKDKHVIERPAVNYKIFPEGNTEDVPNADNSKDDDSENMLDEIMQYMKNNDSTSIILDPNLLAPSRSDDDKIVFVDDLPNASIEC